MGKINPNQVLVVNDIIQEDTGVDMCVLPSTGIVERSAKVKIGNISTTNWEPGVDIMLMGINVVLAIFHIDMLFYLV